MEGEDKGLPERNNKDEQSGAGYGTDQKEVKNKKDVDDGITEIGESSDMGMKKSDKESAKSKVDDKTDEDESELVGISEIENAKTAQGMILEPNKTRVLGLQRINDDGLKVEGGGTDDDSQSKADEFSKNDDLGVQKSVGNGTDQKEGKNNEDVDDGGTETGGSSEMGMQKNDNVGNTDDHQKEGKNVEVVQMDNVAGIEIGGSSFMGMQESDKESGKIKVDDEITDADGGLELVGSSESTIFEPNKTRKINEDGTKVKGGGTDGDDIQSKADELGKNDDLDVQENVGSGTKNQDDKEIEKEQDQDQGVGNQENNPTVLLEQNRDVEQMEPSLREMLGSLEVESQMIFDFINRVESGIHMEVQEFFQHVNKHQQIKLQQEQIIRRLIDLSGLIMVISVREELVRELMRVLRDTEYYRNEISRVFSVIQRRLYHILIEQLPIIQTHIGVLQQILTDLHIDSDDD